MPKNARTLTQTRSPVPLRGCLGAPERKFPNLALAKTYIRSKKSIVALAAELLHNTPMAPTPQAHRRAASPRPSPHASLLALLDDPSPTIWEPVFRELRARGSAPIPALRLATKDQNPRLRARARSLVESHERRSRLRRLASFAALNRSGINCFQLERAMWLFAAIEAPGFDSRPFRRALDELSDNARFGFKKATGDLDKAMVIPNYMGKHFRFRTPLDSAGNPLAEENLERATHHPHNVLVHRVLTSHTGLPLSLAIIWKLVADRLAQPMDIVGIPGHVLVRVPAGKSRVLIDPSVGRMVSRREVREYLKSYDIPAGPDIFEPMDCRAILRRHVANYMRGMGLRGQVGQAEELLTVHALLDE